MGATQADFAPDLVPDFVVELDGFRVANARADKIGLAGPMTKPRLVEKKLGTALFAVEGGALNPQLVRFHRFGEGFDLYFESGFAFRVPSISAPFLTWTEGSVGEGVAAAADKFHLVSFRDPQPPLLLSYMGEPTGLKVTGQPGQWVLRSSTPYKGWVRIIPPWQSTPRPTANAAGLGDLLRDLKLEIPRWTAPAPNLVEVRSYRSRDGLIGAWIFDRPLAVMSPSMARAFEPGAPRLLQIQSSIGQARSGGPRWAKTEELRIRFPNSRWYPGRALVTAIQPDLRPHPTDFRAIADLAFHQATSARSVNSREIALNMLNSFAQRFPEGFKLEAPATAPSLAAAYALLAQVVAPQGRSIWLDQVVWNVGPWSWTLPIEDEAELRRTTALCALALALSSEPALQLAGAMLDVGLRYREIDRAGGLDLVVLGEVRDAVFGSKEVLPANGLVTPFRLATLESLVAQVAEEQLVVPEVVLRADQEFRIATPLSVGPLVPGFREVDSGSPQSRLWMFRAEKDGTKVTSRFGPVPALPSGPVRYSELAR